jgi:hypothetical protein
VSATEQRWYVCPTAIVMWANDEPKGLDELVQPVGSVAECEYYSYPTREAAIQAARKQWAEELEHEEAARETRKRPETDATLRRIHQCLLLLSAPDTGPGDPSNMQWVVPV